MAGPIPVTVNITATGTSPSRKNFGTPLVLAYHTHNTDKVRIYTSLGGMITDGFSASEPAYLLAQACFQQNPTVPQVFVGRGTTAVQQTFTFTVTANADGVPVGLSILDPSGTVNDLYVTPSSETIDQVATALALVIAAASGVSSSTASGAVITTTITTAGNTWYPSLTPHDETVFAGGFQGGTFADTTSTASVATDLAAILLVNANFYGVSTQYIDPTNIAAAAAWVQSNGCLFAYVTADSANLTANTGIGHTLKGDSYTRSCGIYTQTPGDFVTTGLMAQRFTAVAGSDTWAYKTVIGATPDDNLTPTQLANLQTNNLNYYATVAGIECVTDGRSAQGQYMDIQRGIDALANDMQVRVFGLIANSEKVPYTTAGITMVGTQMRASLASFTATPSSPNLFLSSDPGFAPTVTLPDISTISTSDKQNRILNNANFTATTTGAIQDVIINGTLSFG